MKLIDEGKIPLRPGVLRIVDEAIASGVRLAVCSTSNEKAVSNLVSTLMGADRASKFQIYAGDMVKKKKPAPDVYLMAVDQMGLDKDRCVIIEDSHIGVGAAVAAGISCLVTKSSYTQNEDFTGAKMIVEELGDDGDDVVTLETLTSLLCGNDNDAADDSVSNDWDPVGHVEKGGASWTGARMGEENPNKPRTYTPSETYVPSNAKSIGVKMENHVEKGGASWTGARFGDDTPSETRAATSPKSIGVNMENHVEKGGASWTGARFGDSEPAKRNLLKSIATAPKGIGVKMESHIEKGGASWTGARFGEESLNAAEYTPSETYEPKSQGKFTGSEWDSASHKDVSIAQDDTAWTGARLGDKDVRRVGPTPSKWHE
jgi:HAD superfamily hydrolase (TIGR01509 family)